MNELNHSAGKGDKERSPGWRNNYDAIDFHRSEATDGFARRGNRLVKAYGNRVAKFVFPEKEEQHEAVEPKGICNARSPLEFLCTLDQGHSGFHEAHGTGGNIWQQWPQTPADLSHYMLDNHIKL